MHLIIKQFPVAAAFNIGLFISPGILLEISVDGPKAHQQKFPWALIGPGVWGPPRPPVGSRGNAPVGGSRGRSPPGRKRF